MRLRSSKQTDIGVRNAAGALTVVAAFALLVACASSGNQGGPDAAIGNDVAVDQATPDAPGVDLANKDVAGVDGTPDAGTPDSGTPDVGGVDNGTPDNGTPDNGAADTGTDTATDSVAADVPVDVPVIADVPVDVAPLACNSCHGSADNNAPPVDTQGNSSTTLPTVGAHQAHLTALHGLTQPLTCEQCHVVPATVDAPGHIDASPAEITFGALAKTGGANATWTHAAATCSTVYCHGATLNGGTLTTPTWTKVDGTQDACGTCHGLSPKTGRHPSNFGKHSWIGKDCTNCHNGITNSTGSAITNATLHLNGAKDVALKSGGTWNAATKSCNPSCHGNENW